MAIDELIEHCLERAGEELRVVSWYDGKDSDVLFRREDLDLKAVNERVNAVVGRLTWDWEPPTAHELDPLGDELANVQVREEVAILHLPTDDEQGVVLSLDVEAAHNLHQFIVECRTMLGDEFSTQSPGSR